MKHQNLFSASFYLKVIFAASLLILVTISAITYRHTQSLTESIGWVMHAYKTNVQVEQLFSMLKDAETGQRGFIITNDTVLLEPYNNARQQVENAFIQLEKQMETKQQDDHLQNLHRLINARFAQMEVTLSVARDQPLRDDLLKSSMVAGKAIMDSIHLQVSKMAALETSYLQDRQAKYEYKASITPLFSLLLLLFALNVFIFSYWKISHDLNTLKHKNQLLILQSDSIAHAEERNNMALRERNHELEQKNKELASFNHVASHDLQEPLRIVQTYISRLTEKEIGLMSAKGKDYFVRIKLAVTRMRNLIDALLLFSRTNRTDSIFEIADLNLLLDNARHDLSHLLEQKKGSIIAAQLPTLNVIPFQIQQLFTNLIGNSIKYSKPEVPLLILINCEKPAPIDFPNTRYDHARNYYKIAVSDNGIGFEQMYAENIFTLFQRLHHDEEYEGTGIGLSICKKIAENHGGLITAEGKPGIGATFFIYLPA